MFLAAAAMFLVSCHKDDPTPTPEVYLTQMCSQIINPTTGDIGMTTTQDLFWENGLLKKTNIVASDYATGASFSLGENQYIYNGTNCIQLHYVNNSWASDMFFTYENNRMTSALEVSRGDTVGKVTFNSYTADGKIKSTTVQDIYNSKTYEYEFTWENGDLKTIREHQVGSDAEDKIYTYSYDNSPNAFTGIPLTEAIFRPLAQMARRASKHNVVYEDVEYRYSNGRLVYEKDESATEYYTYSDGTTGKQ